MLIFEDVGNVENLLVNMNFEYPPYCPWNFYNPEVSSNYLNSVN